MVPGSHTDNTVLRSGQRAGKEEGVREVDAASPVFTLVGPVRVHVKEHAGVRMGRIRVFPALIEHPAVGQDAGRPVVVLVKAQLPQGAGTPVQQKRLATWSETIDTGHAGVAGSRT